MTAAEAALVAKAALVAGLNARIVALEHQVRVISTGITAATGLAEKVGAHNNTFPSELRHLTPFLPPVPPHRPSITGSASLDQPSIAQDEL